MQLVLNGHVKYFPELPTPSTVADLLTHLALKGDRVALERNGEIVPRAVWASTPLAEGDKIEVVHFVGGGSQ